MNVFLFYIYPITENYVDNKKKKNILEELGLEEEENDE